MREREREILDPECGGRQELTRSFISSCWLRALKVTVGRSEAGTDREEGEEHALGRGMKG